VNGFFGPSRDFEKFLYRYEEASRLLGVNPLARQIFRTLLFDREKPWNMTSLAERLGHSRPTVRALVARNVEGGYMLRVGSRISISDRGSEVLKWVHDETCEIALGHQTGFTEELIRLFRDMSLPEVNPDAATIRFQNDLNIL